VSSDRPVAVVTGAASGIGAATATALGAAGYAVALWDCADLGETTSALQQLRGSVVPLTVDVTQPSSVAESLSRTQAELGTPTAVFTAAGTMQVTPFLELSADAWERTLAVNLGGTFHVLQACAAAMVTAGLRGSMVAVASVAARGPRPDAADYAASKAAIVSLVQSASVALAPRGIRVNAVCPGYVDTPMTLRNRELRAQTLGVTPEAILESSLASVPLGRIAQAEEIAAVSLRLLGEEFGYVTGQAINVCGGLEFN
jgi:NAD(P)-dependent dehydrogenase (short-subunit alcohol dehydrogenase family)